jgi:hypothetical protein
MRRKHRFIDTGEECICGNPPLTARAASDDGCAKRDHAGWQFGGWIRVSKAPPDCTTVTDRRMRDMGDRLRQQWGMRIDFRGSQEIGMARQRANGENAVLHRDAAQLCQLTNINNKFGRYQAQIHRRHQTLTTRQDLGPLAVRCQQFQRVCDAGCTGISESRGFHFGVPLPGQVPAFSLD